MSIDEKKSIVIITPVFEDYKSAELLFKEISNEVGDIAHIVAIDDGSVQNQMDISLLENASLQGTLISLNRNIGHQRAIAVGLSYVEKNFNNTIVVIMDSDGEDKPSSIKKLLDMLRSNEFDIVVARRKKRFVTSRFKLFYSFYKIIFWIFVGRKINFGNFIAIKPHALKRLVSMGELWLNLAGCVLTSKLRVNALNVDRGKRYYGRSKMNFVSLALHGFRALMVFAEDVLVRVGILCALVATFTLVGGVIAIILKTIGFATPGWFSVALGILLIVFLQTGAIALITLMMTGVIKSGSVLPLDFNEFILEIKNTTKSNLI